MEPPAPKLIKKETLFFLMFYKDALPSLPLSTTLSVDLSVVWCFKQIQICGFIGEDARKVYVDDIIVAIKSGMPTN